jgi:hypothetical protein
MTETTVASPAAVNALQPGQWVWAPDGTPLCLVDTHVGWPQRMWMHQDGRSYTAVDRVPYPLTLAEINEPPDACRHRRTQECGHCTRCGRVVAEPRLLHLTVQGGHNS